MRRYVQPATTIRYRRDAASETIEATRVEWEGYLRSRGIHEDPFFRLSGRLDSSRGGFVEEWDDGDPARCLRMHPSWKARRRMRQAEKTSAQVGAT